MDLKKFYNRVYKKGEAKHYSKNLFKDKVPLQVAEALKEISWRGKTVLDVGCGTGLFAYLTKKAGAARVMGIDYSKEAIALANQSYPMAGLEFYCQDFRKAQGRFDVVVSLGAVEHFADPLAGLKKFKKLLKPGGSIIVVAPNWSNTRGYILLTLHYLFKAPITLADKHYLTPKEFSAWAKKLGMSLRWRTFDQSWGWGEKMIRDFNRRLPKVLPKNKNVRSFIKWLDGHVRFFEKSTKANGAVALYHFR